MTEPAHWMISTNVDDNFSQRNVDRVKIYLRQEMPYYNTSKEHYSKEGKVLGISIYLFKVAWL